MPLAILFWVLMIIWLIFGFWREYIPGQPYPINRAGGHILTFILFAIIGWKVFGPVIQ
jgi:hypothetical protein